MCAPVTYICHVYGNECVHVPVYMSVTVFVHYVWVCAQLHVHDYYVGVHVGRSGSGQIGLS